MAKYVDIDMGFGDQAATKRCELAAAPMPGWRGAVVACQVQRHKWVAWLQLV